MTRSHSLCLVRQVQIDRKVVENSRRNIESVKVGGMGGGGERETENKW